MNQTDKPKEEHPALVFAREVKARSVVLPTPGQRNLYDKTDVSRTWARYSNYGAF